MDGQLQNNNYEKSVALFKQKLKNERLSYPATFCTEFVNAMKNLEENLSNLIELMQIALSKPILQKNSSIMQLVTSLQKALTRLPNQQAEPVRVLVRSTTAYMQGVYTR